MKKAAILMTALMAFVALAPVASALHGDGNISRTFLTGGRDLIEFKPHSTNPDDDIGGAGWYHPDDRSGLCFLRVFGTPGVFFYYEGYPKPRVTPNAPNVHAAHVEENGIEDDAPAGGDDIVACPPAVNPAATNPGQFLGTSAFNVWASFGIHQSHLLCTDTFKLCAPDPDTASWAMWDCKGYSADPNPPVAGEVDFAEGWIIGPPTAAEVGSFAITEGCTGPGMDFSDYLDPNNNNAASNPDPHIDQIIPVGQGTTYVLSCYSIDYQAFPAQGQGQRRALSHDWFLVLDAAELDPTSPSFNPANIVQALVDHELAPEDPAPAGTTYVGYPGSIAERGLYDLHGDNGCPAEHPEPAKCWATIEATANTAKWASDCLPANACGGNAPDLIAGTWKVTCTVTDACENRLVEVRAEVEDGSPPQSATDIGDFANATLECGTDLRAWANSTVPLGETEGPLDTMKALKTTDDYICTLYFNWDPTFPTGGYHAKAECRDQIQDKDNKTKNEKDKGNPLLIVPDLGLDDPNS